MKFATNTLGGSILRLGMVRFDSFGVKWGIEEFLCYGDRYLPKIFMPFLKSQDGTGPWEQGNIWQPLSSKTRNRDQERFFKTWSARSKIE